MKQLMGEDGPVDPQVGYVDGYLLEERLLEGVLFRIVPSDDGSKLFMKGSKTGGAFWHIGPDYMAGDGRIYFAEGIATATSIFEATGRPVVITYSAGNMTATAQAVRAQVGTLRELVIVADNDDSGTGQREAEKAAQAVGGAFVVSPIGDANDYAQAGHDLGEWLEPSTPPEESYLISADDFSSQPAPIKWLIKGWIQDGGMVMVHGPSGGGKTFVVLDWCLHIASELKTWAGMKVSNGEVVYLAGEGHHGLRGRVAAWKHSHRVNKLNMWLSRAGVDLNTPAGYTKVKKAIDSMSIKPRLIVVDTLHRFLNGDENSAEDAKTMIDACAGLMRDYGCAVLLVHHTGVSVDSQDRARGSSSWRGALENEISVVPAKKDKPIEIAPRKTKDAEMPPPIFAQLSTVAIPGWFDEDGEQVTNAVIAICDAPEVEEDYTKEKVSLAAARKYFEGAVMAKGRPENGLPFISDDAWNEYSMTREHASDGARRTALSTTKKDLKAAGYIMEVRGGFSPTPDSMTGVFAGAFLGLRPY
jgi:KaiC/GvpD/RAD55 family RecA-like ATPase